LAALDGLRGFALLLVLLDHSSDEQIRIFGALFNRAGKYGVFLFFVLSAFLLTHLLLSRPASDWRKAGTWFNYAVRRFLRIIPIYYLAILILAWKKQFTWHRAWDNFLLRDGYRQFWTIPVEMKFYLLLPGLALALGWCRERRWRPALLAALGSVVLAWALYHGERLWCVNEHVFLISENLAPFLLGCVTAALHQALGRVRHVPKWVPWLCEIVAIAALATVLLRIPLLYNAVFSPEKRVRRFGDDEVICGLLWSLAIFGLIHGRGWVRRAFEWLPLRYLGWISFSAYLCHWRLITTVNKMGLAPAARFPVFILCVLALASLSYFLIERPLSRIRVRGGHIRSAEPTLPAPIPPA
jgi:peptidoglycan/LPS O-acetylase OafA/YrhL